MQTNLPVEDSIQNHNIFRVLYACNSQLTIDNTRLKSGTAVVIPPSCRNSQLSGTDGNVVLDFTPDIADPFITECDDILKSDAEKRIILFPLLNALQKNKLLIIDTHSKLKSVVSLDTLVKKDNSRERRSEFNKFFFILAFFIKLQTIKNDHRSKIISAIKYADVVLNSLHYIFSNYINANLQPKDIIKNSFIGRTYFFRLFKLLTGTTITDYINQFRSCQALILLTETDMNMTCICHETGFKSQARFCQILTKLTGYKPSKIREQLNSREKIKPPENSQWKLLADIPFDTRYWDIHDGRWRFMQGECSAIGGEFCILVSQIRITGDVRIEYSGYAEEKNICDLSAFIYGSDKSPRSGYLFGFGSNYNLKTCILKNNYPLAERDDILIKPLQEYRIVIEKSGSFLRFYINNRKILEYEDLFPFSGGEYCRAGLYTYTRGSHFTSFKIFKHAIPANISVFELGDRFFNQKLFAQAREIYEDIIENNRCIDDTILACFKRAMCFFCEQKNDLAENGLKELIREYPQNTYLLLIMKNLARINIENGKYTDALRLLDDINARFAGSSSTGEIQNLYQIIGEQCLFGNAKIAVRVLKHIINNFSDSIIVVDASLQLIAFYKNENKISSAVETALSVLNKFRLIDQYAHKFYEELFRVYLYTGQYESACIYMRRCLRHYLGLTHQNTNLFNNYINDICRLGKYFSYVEARKIFLEIKKQNNSKMIGLGLAKMDMLKNHKSVFYPVLKANQKNQPYLLTFLASIYLMQGKYYRVYKINKQRKKLAGSFKFRAGIIDIETGFTCYCDSKYDEALRIFSNILDNLSLKSNLEREKRIPCFIRLLTAETMKESGDTRSAAALYHDIIAISDKEHFLFNASLFAILGEFQILMEENKKEAIFYLNHKRKSLHNYSQIRFFKLIFDYLLDEITEKQLIKASEFPQFYAAFAWHWIAQKAQWNNSMKNAENAYKKAMMLAYPFLYNYYSFIPLFFDITAFYISRKKLEKNFTSA
ncbi:MAG: hypothetical protein A2096_01175 [Spirochaetes bacterium GWF1_41_5]|nr:MAG: hypothetical protein A2096_01175 [Spirochaetes bacterium GWF1_41_5]HBE02981.1 hypothetical protein [Spirochaetia bacterium]